MNGGMAAGVSAPTLSHFVHAHAVNAERLDGIVTELCRFLGTTPDPIPGAGASTTELPTARGVMATGNAKVEDAIARLEAVLRCL